MKNANKYIIIFTIFLSLQLTAQEQQFTVQEQQLAYQYYFNGEYEKAVSLFKTLRKKNKFNTNYLNYLIDCYQYLGDFESADIELNNQLKKFPNQYNLFVELGYNLQMQHKQNEAEVLYKKAFNLSKKSAGSAFSVGRSFRDNNLLDYALQTYQYAKNTFPKNNFNHQIASIYGEKGDVNNMLNEYLDLLSGDEKQLERIKNHIGKFLTDDPEYQHNITLRKLLIKRLQSNPHNKWNQLLSWLYIQQGEYEKALIQEKAIYKRNSEDLSSIFSLGYISFEKNKLETSKKCFIFIIENTINAEIELRAKLSLIQIDIKSKVANSKIEEEFLNIFSKYGKNTFTLGFQVEYSKFLAFNKNETSKAISLLKEALDFSASPFQKAYVKTQLADILVFENKFSTALIYYTQVQNNMKNHELGQNARFKIAQTSYYKGDFEWAQTQLKVLKNSTSQLIANDALDLNLLITDNTVKDSLKIALKKYARAELLELQNKNKSAIDTLHTVLEQFKEHSIIDEVLFKQAKIFEKINDYESAKNNYLKIISINKDDILVDDAHYFLAELYLNKLKNIEKAKEYYQKIIFEYPSSIFLVDARKKFRELRGDNLNL